MQVRTAAKKDQADPIAVTTLDKLTSDFLNNLQTINSLPVQNHVLGVHAAGNIHRQQQITTGYRETFNFADPLGPRHGQTQEPRQRARETCAPPLKSAAFLDVGLVRYALLAAAESGTSSEEEAPAEAASDFVRAVIRAATADLKKIN